MSTTEDNFNDSEFEEIEPRSERYQEFLECERRLYRQFFPVIHLDSAEYLETERAIRAKAMSLLNLPKDHPKHDPEAQTRIIEVDNFLISLEGNVFSGQPESYASSLLRSPSNLDLKKTLEKQFLNKLVIDLGCGLSSDVLDFFSTSAKGYLGVDLVPETLRQKVKNRAPQTDYLISILYDDALHFTAGLPDNTGNFFLAGMDNDILHDRSYRTRLAQQIVRTTEIGGTTFVYASDEDFVSAIEKFGLRLKSDRKIDHTANIRSYLFKKEA